MSDLAFYCFQYALALLLAPLLPGIIARVKAKVAGRHGKPVLQLYFDIVKGLRKGEVISHVTTPVFTLGPVVGLATVLCALALLPLGGMASPLRFSGDFLLAAYLLGLGRFLTMLAALDTGSSFEGMGASREAAFSALSEPVLFLCLLTLVGVGSALGMHDALSLSGMLGGRPAHEWLLGRAELLLVPVVFFVLLLVENSRIPVDDPTTHLELTMIHEVMILDHSGPSLSFIEYGAALKLWFFAALPAGILVPDLPLWQQSLCWLACIFAVAVLVGIGVFRASGAMDWLIDGVKWLVGLTGCNADWVGALPTAVMKPLSGSGARGMMVDAMQTYGADSFVGRLSCIFQGSTDTTFYILAVYFGSVGISKTRHAVACGLLADLAGIVAAIGIAYVFFGS